MGEVKRERIECLPIPFVQCRDLLLGTGGDTNDELYGVLDTTPPRTPGGSSHRAATNSTNGHPYLATRPTTVRAFSRALADLRILLKFCVKHRIAPGCDPDA
jgi:hypothetical protein